MGPGTETSRRNMGPGAETPQKEHGTRQPDRKWHHTETPLWTEWHTLLNILPYPKLRLWAVKIPWSAFLIAVKFWKIPRNLKFARFERPGYASTFYTSTSRWIKYSLSFFPAWWQLHHKSHNLTQDPLNRGYARNLINYVYENTLNMYLNTYQTFSL